MFTTHCMPFAFAILVHFDDGSWCFSSSLALVRFPIREVVRKRHRGPSPRRPRREVVCGDGKSSFEGSSLGFVALDHPFSGAVSLSGIARAPPRGRAPALQHPRILRQSSACSRQSKMALVSYRLFVDFAALTSWHFHAAASP